MIKCVLTRGVRLWEVSVSGGSTVFHERTLICHGYEMIGSASLANHLISNKREWNNSFITDNHKILLDLADFALQSEQPEDNLLVAISRVWYNGSHSMAAKPIKSLKLHYNYDPVFNKRVYTMNCVKLML